MPASYAHYRFGQQLPDLLSSGERRLTQHFRQLFLTGLQGPDPFFYHNPLFRTKVVKLGSTFHAQTGREFFTHACTCVTSDGAKAYLLGLLGHYALDSVCHPFVNEQTKDGKISHVELESEFDRFLMKKDGISLPHTFDRGESIRLTRGECVTASAFFPTMKPGQLRTSVKNTSRFLKILSAPKPGTRKFLRRVMSIPGGQLRHHLMLERRNSNCSHLNAELFSLYNKALERYPLLWQQLCDHMQKAVPLGPEFDVDFG